jgi:ParE toxin of type II toxin-antitoxin system, parDE
VDGSLIVAHRPGRILLWLEVHTKDGRGLDRPAMMECRCDSLPLARRGDYRVSYRIDDDLRIVTVMAIEHRSDAYRPRQR